MKSKWMKGFGLIASLALFACGGSDGKDGANGTNGINGTNSTIQTSVVPSGDEHCGNGGIKIEVLLDGVVQDAQTQYICNGAQGEQGLQGEPGPAGATTIQTSAEPAGEHCADGGVRIEVLLGGAVQHEQTQYICNGSEGLNGTNGSNASIQTSVEPAGENCSRGGIKIKVLQDGIAQNDQTQYICNNSSCQPGYHDGGDGVCVLLDRCSIGYHSNGLGECVPRGQCAAGYHDGGDGACVLENTCSVHFHNGGDDTDTCVHETTCLEGYHSNGLGECVPMGQCAAGYHDGGDSACVLENTCSVGYHDGGGDTDTCVPQNTCLAGYHNGGNGVCVLENTCLEGWHNRGDGICVMFDTGIEFISIPAGSFTLTHDTGSYSSGDTVTLAAFKLGKTPVTVAEFKKCVEAGNCTSEHYNTVSDNALCNYNRGDGWRNHPMNCVDWYGAKEYCEAIGGRLPTEEEWEYAATHNGTEHLNTTYSWGNDAPQHCVTANYYGSASPYFCNGRVETSSMVGTSEVGTYSPAGDSPLGLVDMSGNVWEWTESLYSFEGSNRVLKGGSWVGLESNLRVTIRSLNFPTNWLNNYGFRCAE